MSGQDNPYVGLRPFFEKDSLYFFGREQQTAELLDILRANRFLGVVGSSGSGKSSLVRAGLLPRLRDGFLVQDRDRWRTVQMKPGDAPIGNLAFGLLEAPEKPITREAVADLEQAIREGHTGAVVKFLTTQPESNANLFLLVDQFEEIFAFRGIPDDDSEKSLDLGRRKERARRKAEAADFVDLLLALAEQRDLPIYVALTMRTHFLDDCDLFHGLPEALNRGRYLVPRMTREQSRDAVECPALLVGAQVAPRLLDHVLNELGVRFDRLPVLQHALLRTWDEWQRAGSVGAVDLQHYELAGGLERALDRDAEGALKGLDIGVTARVFKRLTATDLSQRCVRSPARISELVDAAGVDLGTVEGVVRRFEEDSRSFVQQSPDGMPDNPRVDISYESLMRVWKRLRTWGEEEARSVQIYRRLRDWALRWEKGDADLWRGPDLASALAWRNREAPKPQWAERYGGRDALQIAMRFLDASEQAQRAEVEAVATKRRNQLRRARRWAWGSGLITLMLLGGILGYFVAYVWNYDAYFNRYVKVRGEPRGIGPLSAEQIRHRALSYKITKMGYLGVVVRMDSVNATGQFTTGGMTTGFESSSGETAKSEVRWEYVHDANDRVAYEVSLDRKGQRVRSIVYSPDHSKAPHSRNAYMMGKTGSLASQVGSCASFLRYEYSPEGYEVRTHYLDQIGNPTAGKDGVFIMQKDFDSQGNEIRVLSLWKDELPMNDKVGNAEQRASYDELGNVIGAEMFDAAGSPINIKTEDYQQITLKYDARGNEVERVSLKADGSPSLGENGCHRLRYSYDERRTRIACLDQLGQPAVADGVSYAAWEIHYDDKGRVAEYAYYDKDRQSATGPGGAFREAVSYDADDNITAVAYFSADSQPTVGSSGFHKQISAFEGGREVRTEYVGVDGKPVELAGGYVAIKRRYDPRGNEERLAYLGPEGRPVLNHLDGFAVKRASFDGCGRETESRYLDEDEKPIRLDSGYAVITKVYDEGNNVVEEAYLDEREQRIRSAAGYARVKREYDRHRNIIEEVYFDEHGKAVLIEEEKESYAKRTRRYDDHNALIEEAYFGAGGEPILSKNGWASIKYVKNATGQNIETAYFGTNGKPLKLEKHYAKMTSRNNDRNALIEEAYFSSNGDSVPNIETIYFGPDGKQDKVEKGYARLTRRYDDHNAQIEEAYFDVRGDPYLNDKGWARITYANDERGRPIEMAYFGVRGEPVIEKDERYHRARWVLDNRGNMLKLAVFGTDGKPLEISLGDSKRRCARFVWRFDANDKEIGSECFDAVGKRVR